MKPDYYTKGICEFCDIVSGETPLYGTNPHIEDSYNPPYNSLHCVAWPDAAPLTPGHIIIVPKYHKLSTAELDENIRADLISTVMVLSAAISETTQENLAPYIFEHGSSKEEERLGCSITHVHLHLLFAPSRVLENVEDISDFQQFEELESAWKHVLGSDYYLIGDLNDNHVYAVRIIEDPLLKCDMFLRRMFSRLLKDEESYDYLRYLKGNEKDELADSILEYYKILKTLSNY